MSTTWVALLRGINLGANNRVAMDDLRELLESRGYHDVRTYLQSGNALFTVGRTAAATMERTIASAIKRELGVETVVLVRSAAEIATVVEHNPFAGRRGVDPSGCMRYSCQRRRRVPRLPRLTWVRSPQVSTHSANGWSTRGSLAG